MNATDLKRHREKLGFSNQGGLGLALKEITGIGSPSLIQKFECGQPIPQYIENGIIDLHIKKEQSEAPDYIAPRKGDCLFLSGNERGLESKEIQEECFVTRVGKKFFYVITEDGHKAKFRLSDWQDVTGLDTWRIWRTKEDFECDQEVEKLRRMICNVIENKEIKLGLHQCRKIAEILNL